MANLSLRDEIATNKDVQDLFQNYTMEMAQLCASTEIGLMIMYASA